MAKAAWFGRRVKGATLPVLLFLAPVLVLSAPRLTVVVFVLMALGLIFEWRRAGHSWRELLAPSPELYAFAALGAYLFINASWAVAPLEAVGKAATFAAFTLLTFASVRVIPILDQRQLKPLAFALVAGATVGTALLVLELATLQTLARDLTDSLRWLLPSSKHLRFDSSGAIAGIEASELNRNAALAALGLWPGLLILRSLAQGATRTTLTVLLFILTVVAVGISEHDSSQIAIPATILVFGTAWFWPVLTCRALLVLWCAGFVVFVPLATAAYKAELYRAEWLPKSYRARIILWNYTASKLGEAPLLGVGIRSTRPLNEAQPRVRKADLPEGFVFPQRTGNHAHDLFLQCWYEMGVIGVVLVMLVGAMVIRQLDRLPPATQPYACALFTAFALIASFAWDIWQTWLMASYALAAMYMTVAVTAATNECSGRSGAARKNSASELAFDDSIASVTLPR
jgi:O-antigen ligase